MFKEVIVVEGLHDQQKLESIYPDIECIITGGSAISPETLSLIQITAKNRGVILFLDPDYPGKQITSKILAIPNLENVKVASIKRGLAYSKNSKKIGIEHVSKANIIESLQNLVTIHMEESSSQIQNEDLIIHGLIGTKFSKEKRTSLCDKLHIPYSNGKTLLKYLKMMRYTKIQLDEVMK